MATIENVTVCSLDELYSDYNLELARAREMTVENGYRIASVDRQCRVTGHHGDIDLAANGLAEVTYTWFIEEVG